MRATMKVSKFVVTSAVALTGALMFSFQNCGRIQGIEVSDLAGAVAAPNQLIESGNTTGNDDSVSVQIQGENGVTYNVDDRGNQTVVDSNNSPAANSGSSSTTDTGTNSGSGPTTDTVEEEPIVFYDDDDGDELCEYKSHIKNDKDKVVHGKQTGVSNSDTLDEYKKIHCRKKSGNSGKSKRRCADLIQHPGFNVIDLAKLDDVSVLHSIKGNTVIYTSDPNRASIRGVIIDQAVGKTVLCGVHVTRLDVKKGNLHLREGAVVKACGEIKGTISKDDDSVIDGAISDK